MATTEKRLSAPSSCFVNCRPKEKEIEQARDPCPFPRRRKPSTQHTSSWFDAVCSYDSTMRLTCWCLSRQMRHSFSDSGGRQSCRGKKADHVSVWPAENSTTAERFVPSGMSGSRESARRAAESSCRIARIGCPGGEGDRREGIGPENRRGRTKSASAWRTHT